MKALEKESFKKRICVLLFAVLSIAAVIVIALNTKTVFAEDDADEEDAGYDEVSELREEFDAVFGILAEQDSQLSKIVYIIAPGELVASMEGESDVVTIGDELLYNEDSPAHKGLGITSVIGLMSLLVYGVIQIVKIAKDEKGSIESWLQLAIVLVLGILALSYVREILDFLDRLGLKLFASIQRAITGDYNAEAYSEAYRTMWSSFTESVHDAASGSSAGSDDNSGSIIGGLISSFLPVITTALRQIRNSAVAGIFKILMYFTYYSILVGVYGLLFELVIRRIFAPIAITGIAVEGIRSPGVRYLRNYFSLYVRLAMFVVIISLCCRASSWTMVREGWSSTREVFGESRFFWEQARDDTGTFVTRTILWGGGNLANNLALRPLINRLLTINCIRAATKALMNSSAQIAKEVAGGNA